ncbi:MAG: hypothetical protein GY708_02520 [Actinomycetia bacterium]|nr:hypothetical protein [Actinomycetes bacterium]
MAITRSLRTAAPLVALALGAAACTSGGEKDAAPTTLTPVEPTTTTVAAVVPSTSGLPRADEPALVEIVLPPTMIVSDGGTIREIRGDEATVLARVSALELGQDPEDGERFGLIDVGGARSVVAEVHRAGISSIRRYESDGTSIGFGEGNNPATDADGRWIVFARGGDVVLASGSGDELAVTTVGSVVVDIAMTGDGTAVAVLTDQDLSVVSFDQSGFGATTPVPVVGDVSAVAWVDSETLSVAVAGSTGGTVSVLGADARPVQLTDVHAEIVDLDWSSDGSIAVATTSEGEIRWVKQGAWGPLESPAAEATRW